MPTFVAPPVVDVTFPPTYMPVTVPKISEVPTTVPKISEVPTTVPKISEVPTTVPKISEVPTVDVLTVPTYDKHPTLQPTSLPPGWWRLLPPWEVAGGGEGAYNVQAGKRQILALA
jgi:hypothetical protein